MYKLQISDEIFGAPGTLLSEEQYRYLSPKDKYKFTRVQEAIDALEIGMELEDTCGLFEEDEEDYDADYYELA